ncbi:PFL_4695 family integrating conjugative element protein [Motilimonas pumila]|nr:integrating conjugative element protein [Motilimonas pumila]
MKTLWIIAALTCLPSANAAEKATEHARTQNVASQHTTIARMSPEKARALAEKMLRLHKGKTVVIYDSGHTLPIERISKTIDRRAIEKSFMTSLARLKNLKFDGSQLTQRLVSYFPYQSTSLKVGILPNRVYPKPLPHLQYPVAIIGSDLFSLNWLTLNAKELSRVGAAVVVAQADTYHNIQYIQQQLPHALVVPAKADFLATEFGLTVYPVLLTQQGAYQ